ncbi:MAG: LysR family transcriptional regulator [Pseudomonadota bacterium]
MDLQSLRLFVRAAELKNISGAGRELGMSPATASTRLAALEDRVGADLLRRSTRKVALSLEGEEFLPFAREILAQEQAALNALGQGRADVSGTLRFAAPSTFAEQYIAPKLSKFVAQNPGIHLDLRLTDQPTDLILGSFDLALRNAALDDSNLRARRLAPDQRVLCAAPRYLDEYGVPKSMDELADHALLGFQFGQSVKLRHANGALMDFAPGESRGRIVMDDGACLKRATICGAGISLNSVWSVYEELCDGRLIRVLPTVAGADDIALWLIYPKANVLTAKVRVFIDFLLEEVAPNIPAISQA